MDERHQTHDFFTQHLLTAAHHNTSRQLLDTDLEGQIFCDDAQLLTKVFAVDDVPTTWVKAALKALSKVPDAFDDLKNAHKGVDMYGPLEQIFGEIMQSVPASARSYPRMVWRSKERVLVDEDKLAGLRRKPGFAFFDNENHKQLWRHCAAHVEVKPKALAEPHYHNDVNKTPKGLLTQAADVSRAHLASRPFQLSSAFLVISGSDFYGLTWDRAGGIISKRFEIEADTELFVRLVLQMVRRLSPTALGQDPTVTDCTQPLDLHPLFSLDINGCGTWTTVERLFQSISLVGRGTSVYVVTNGKEKKVMKSAWRRKNCEGELSICDKIKSQLQPGHEWPKGVAHVVGGGDVNNGGGALNLNSCKAQALTVSHIRKGAGGPLEEDPVLHRLLLDELGQPLWKYDKPSMLLEAMRDAVQGHKNVLSLGCLHCDISAGNVFLSASPAEQKHAGFITDFDCAQEHPANGEVDPSILGTVQFMACELLKCLQSKQPIPREPYHDLESFIYVFVYAIYLHENQNYHAERKKEDEDNWAELDAEIQNVFGGTNIHKLLSTRKALMSEPEYLPKGPLRRCAETLLDAVGHQYAAIWTNRRVADEAAENAEEVDPDDFVPIPRLTHESVIETFGKFMESAKKKGL